MLINAISQKPQGSIQFLNATREAATGKKVHRLVVLGRLSKIFAAGLGSASIVLCFICNPVCAVGIPIAFVLAAIGQKFYPGFQCAPFVPGQPIGIVNASNNCWMNALMQLMLHVPSLRQTIQDLPSTFEAFKTFSQKYRQSQEQKQFTSSGDSQSLRLCLHGTSNHVISSQVSRQEDAAEGLAFIMNRAKREGSSIFNQIEEVKSGGNQFHSDYLIPVDLFNVKKASFDQLLREYFYCTKDTGTQRRYLSHTPQEFLVQLNRFTYVGAQPSKINDCVDVPLHYFLSGHCVRSGVGAPYTCDAFIQHKGSSFSSGHYVAYLRNSDGSWWCCNDGATYSVSVQEAQTAMKTAYFYHFKRI